MPAEPGAPRRRRSGASPAALLAAAALAAACRSSPGQGPRPTSIAPDRGAFTLPVAVRIRGEGFTVRVNGDFADPARDDLDARYQALLGTVPLQDVVLQPDGSLAATVPAQIASGVYDLTVIDPRGRSGTLARAYRVLLGDDPAANVAGFRIDPIGAQEAYRPFPASIVAVDASGAVAEGFNGSVRLSDRTGTAVPAAAARFAAGRWTGRVEVRAPDAADVLTVLHDSGASGSSAPFAVTSPPAVAARFSTPPVATVAGQCSGPVTVLLQEAFGEATGADRATALALAPSSPAGFALFGDAACTTPISAATVEAGRSSVSAWFVATSTGATDLTASAPGLAPATQRLTVAAGPPASLALVSAPQALTAGACSQPATIEVRDAYGNPTAGAGALSLEAVPAGGLGFFTDASCSSTAGSLALAAGAARGDFHFSGTAAQTVLITVAGAGVAPASQDAIVRPADNAARLAFLTPPPGAAAGACSGEAVLQAQDSFGNAVSGAGAVLVSLSAAPGTGFTTYSDAACTTPASTFQIGAGQSTGGFHWRGTVAGSVRVTASASTLTGATQDASVGPAPPAQVVFSGAPQSLPAGSCSAAVPLQLQDGFGNASPAGAPLAIALSGAPASGFGIYSDPSCSLPLSGVTVAAGGSAASFHFKGTQAGPVVITAAPNGLPGGAQTEQLRSAPATRLVFTSTPQAVVAGACSGAAALEARDAHDNPAALPGGATVSLAAAPQAGFRFFQDAACSVPAATVFIPAGGTGTSFFFSGTAAGPVTATATAAGLAAAAQAETVTAGPPAQLAFAGPAQTVAAGTCSAPVTVESRDAHGNPSPASGTAATSIGLAASPAAGLTFHAGAGCSGAAVSAVALDAGASSTTFSFQSTAAGPVALTASAPPLAPASQLQSVTAAAAIRLAFLTAPQTQLVGLCSAVVTLRTVDGSGNPSPVSSPLTIDLAASPAAGFSFYSDAACTAPVALLTVPSGGQPAGFHFKGTAAGTVTVSATTAGMPAVSQAESIVPSLPDRLVFTSAAQTVTAGACSGAVGLQLVDAYANPSPAAAGTTVALSAAPAEGLTFFSGPGCTGAAVSSLPIAAGASAASFSFRATTSGAVTLTASASGTGPYPTQTETVTAASPDHLAFSSASQTVAAGACSAAVALQLLDAFGNTSPAAAPTTVSLSAAPAAGLSFFSGPGCTGAAVSAVSMGAGSSAASFSFRATTSGAVTLTASASGLAPDPSQAVVVEPSAPSHLVLTGAPQTVAAGACSAAAGLQALDARGNLSPVPASTTVTLSAAPAAGFSFFAGPDCTGAAVSSLSMGAGTSAASFSFRGTASGTVTLTASAPGMAPDPSQLQTISPAAPDHLLFTSAPQTITAGACSGAAGLQTLDAHGNVAPVSAPTTVALSAAPAAGLSFHDGPGCAGAAVSSLSIPAGASAASFSFRGTASGTVTLTASAGGLTPDPAQAETVVPGALDHFTWSLIPSPQATALPFAVAVTARDAWGNAAPSFTGSAALTASAGSLTCSSGCTSGTTTGGFTAGVWTGSVAVSPQATAVSLLATSGTATGSSGTFDVSGAASRSPPVARFTASPLVIVSGNQVSFDASGSSDGQTPAAQLSVSWDFEATAASMDGASAPAAAPWTAWSTAKTAAHNYINNGTAPVVYHPRLAVRDTEAGLGGPDLAYTSLTLVVLPNGNGNCTVDTSSDADDGAQSCQAKGADGRLSLREAIRIANTAAFPVAIDFARAMTIVSSGTLTLSKPAHVAARPGVVLDTGTLSVAAAGVVISGLELSRPASPVVVQSGADATFRDVTLHDGAGILVKGRARLDRLRLSACKGSCIQVDDPGAALALFGSELRGSGTNTGLALTACAGTGWNPAVLGSPFQPYNGSVLVAGNLFTGFATAVDSGCSAAVLAHNTFAGNATGVHGTGAHLLDSIFSAQTTTAVSAAACPGFAASGRHVVWQNASDGCLAAEVVTPAMPWFTFSADPRYVFPAAGDYRLQAGSPARDWGASTNSLDLDGPGPGRYLGTGPDRGGRESY